MKDKDIERIINYNLGPINISVQTTNKELRCKMLNNRFAGDALDKIEKLYEGGIEMNGQIVLCKGVNDKDELRRSIEDLRKYLPFMRSVSVVPAGLTKFREGLYPLELFTKEDAGEVIDLIESYQKEIYEEYGLHFIHASDEWYILAERDFPDEERYDGYIQLENGVGMMRLLDSEFHEALANLKVSDRYEEALNITKTVSMATGKLAYPLIRRLADEIEDNFKGVKINVYEIRNDFFGENITVAGLITGTDLMAQLKGKNLGEKLLLPSTMIRTGEEVFLDDVTLTELENTLQVSVNIVESDGMSFLESVVFDTDKKIRDNGNYVYIKAYED